MSLEPLSAEQVAAYARDGYLLVSGLIPPDIVAKAAETLARLNTKNTSNYFMTDAPEIVACYNETVRAAAAQLKGGAPDDFGTRKGALAIVSRPEFGEWEWPRGHIDGALLQDDKTVDPPPFRIASMLYLSTVEPRGGGTIVWPGSHRRLETVHRVNPIKYGKAHALNRGIPSLDIGEPVEVTAAAGDLLFYEFLCAHAGSKNRSDVARLALNQKW